MSKGKYIKSETHRRNLSKSLTGRKLSENHIKNLSISLKGKPAWNKGKKGLQIAWNKGLKGINIGWVKGIKRTKEDNDKKRVRQIGNKQSKETIEKRKKTYKLINLNKGSKNGMWNGGTSFEPYSLEWNDKLREYIRTRDNRKCQICGLDEKYNRRKLCVHHIDYDKKNCKLNNLISLCNRCHNNTNINRKYWKWQLQLFMKLFGNTAFREKNKVNDIIKNQIRKSLII